MGKKKSRDGQQTVWLPSRQRQRLYRIDTGLSLAGTWLCRFASPNGSVCVDSHLVSRTTDGHWGCSCKKVDCAHVGAAKVLYEETDL